jgi:hypothetical protein
LPFWNMSMVIYEKTMYFCFIIWNFLLFKANFELRTINSKFGFGFVLSFCIDHSYLDMVDRLSNKKNSNKQTFWSFSQVFRLILPFRNMSRVIYEKNYVFLLFHMTFFTF